MSFSEIIDAIEKAGAASNWRVLFTRAGTGSARVFRLGGESALVSMLDYTKVMQHFDGVVFATDAAKARARRVADAATAANE